ncbi:MAG: hypothetical protein AAF358_23990 [Pseudomonadota bacterium]
MKTPTPDRGVVYRHTRLMRQRFGLDNGHWPRTFFSAWLRRYYLAARLRAVLLTAKPQRRVDPCDDWQRSTTADMCPSCTC